MRVLMLMLFAASVSAQTKSDWSTTNQVSPYSAPVNIPQVNVPQVNIPQVNTVEIPAGTNAPPAPPAPQRRVVPAYQSAPTVGDVARRGLVKMTPPVLPKPKSPSAQTNFAASSSAAPVSATGRLWFVHAYGKDSNPGDSQQLPVRSLQRAAELAQPGDTVRVASGNYETFHTVRSGTKTRPISFDARDQNVIVSPGKSTNENITVHGTDYVVIQGFTVQGAGIRVANSRGAILRGNECSGNTGVGIELGDDCQSAVQDALVEGNRIHDNAGHGLGLSGVVNSIVQNNLIYNNGGGLQFVGAPDCDKASISNAVVNNTIVEPQMPGLQMATNATDNIFFNNLIVSDEPWRGETGHNQVDSKSNLFRKNAEGLFQAPGTGDYRLLPTSPARNVGQLRFAGMPAPTYDLTGQRRHLNWATAAGALE